MKEFKETKALLKKLDWYVRYNAGNTAEICNIEDKIADLVKLLPNHLRVAIECDLLADCAKRKYDMPSPYWHNISPLTVLVFAYVIILSIITIAAFVAKSF